MAITFKVGTTPEVAAEEEQPKPQASIELIARTTLDGNFAIFDHLDVDIVVMPDKNKVVCFAKKEMSDGVYDVQKRMFEFLRKRGVIIPETVMGGNVYGSLEAVYPAESDIADPTQAVIFSIGKFIEEERPYFMWDAAHKAEEDERILNPPDDEATDFDPAMHDPNKGMQKDVLGMPSNIYSTNWYSVY
tara:strand:+ start:562 stop:1128 length:567 start_codon:yes stop_codon:yes gene_type:complete